MTVSYKSASCGCIIWQGITRHGIAEMCAIHKAAPDLYSALTEIMDGFDRGVFVRDISNDSNPDWALKLLPFIAALSRAKQALSKADGK